jgi:hypothetical protein
MKKTAASIALIGIFLFFFNTAGYAWVYVDTSQIPAGIISESDYAQIIYNLHHALSGNAKNYPGAFALANVGGYPIGDSCIGDYPHMFFGVSGTLGLGNLKYYDEDIPRQKNIYPAYAPNASLFLGFGLKKGFDILFKVMLFTSEFWRPPVNQKSAKLNKLNYYTLGAKLRKNLVGKKTLIPNIFNFGGVTISTGLDFTEGIIDVKGQYNYNLGTFTDPGPPNPGTYSFTLNTYYDFDLKWLMFAVNAQALVYVDFLWIFDLYTGFGVSATYGYLDLNGSGVGPVTRPNPSNFLQPVQRGLTFGLAQYHYYPRPIMGLFIAGLEINIWALKLNAETMVNISNGKDINFQVGTRIQF